MIVSNIKNTIKYNLKNIPGWRSKRKIVVFECDDWGTNRIPSAEKYKKLLENGIPVDNSPYNRFDTIERKEDLEALFEILLSFKDKNGRNAVFTPFFNMANPNFEKIRESNFEKYHYEKFTETLSRYGEFEDVTKLYREGIDENIFLPQFHGREHLNVSLWMEYLKRDDRDVKKGFNHNFYSVPADGLSEVTASFRPTFYYRDKNEVGFLKNSIKEGTDLFEEIFGYRATVFDPPNGVFPSVLEEELFNCGIKTIVANRFRLEPVNDGKFKKKYYSFGQKNQYGQYYYIRNCAFEPYDDRSVDYCLRMVGAAFRWGKPAIISTHRVNYNGGIDPKNREKGLINLKQLIKILLDKWPEIEFLSSGEFSVLLKNDNEING